LFTAAGLLLLGWLLNTPPGVLGKADAVGYAVCHRISDHSFHIIDRAMPLCARCSGMYLGALAGLVFQSLTAWRRASWPSWGKTSLLALLVGFFAFDGSNSFLHLVGFELPTYEPNNLLRLFSGAGMGLVIAAAVYPSFNQTAWRDWDNRPAISSWRGMAGMLASGTLLALLVLTDNPVILYPLALASAATVVLLLTMIYTVVWLMLWRQENRYTGLAQMIVPLTGGFLLALLQIVAFNAVRFWLTGSWDGFVLG
jgi:uncharacterized membrane protein